MLAQPTLLCYSGYTSSERFVFLFVGQIWQGKAYQQDLAIVSHPSHLRTPNHQEQDHLSIYLLKYPVSRYPMLKCLVAAPPSTRFFPHDSVVGGFPDRSTPNLRFQKSRGRSIPNAPSNAVWSWRTGHKQMKAPVHMTFRCWNGNLPWNKNWRGHLRKSTSSSSIWMEKERKYI